MVLSTQLIIALLASLGAGVGAGYILRKMIAQQQKNSAEFEVQKQLLEAKAEAQSTILEAKTKGTQILQEAKDEERRREAEIHKLEERIAHKEESLEKKLNEFETEKRELVGKVESIRAAQENLKKKEEEHAHELERIAGMSVAEAKDALFKDLEKHHEGDFLERLHKLELAGEERLGRKAYINALGRPPSGDELAAGTSRGDLEGSPGQSQLISELNGGGGGNLGVSPDQRADQSILDAYKSLAEDRTRRFKDYEAAKGPFNLDEVLVAKRGEAREQIDPYYNETLSDYLLGVRRKRERSSADTQDLLAELSATEESFTGSTKLMLDESLNRAREGFAEAGLFESGQRLRSEGLLGTEAGMKSEDFMRRSALRRKGLTSGLSRTLEDVGLESTMRERDIERERFTGTETLAARLAGEAGQRYVTEFQQALPPELQANQNFDLLKQIGIYS